MRESCLILDVQCEDWPKTLFMCSEIFRFKRPPTVVFICTSDWTLTALFEHAADDDKTE